MRCALILQVAALSAQAYAKHGLEHQEFDTAYRASMSANGARLRVRCRDWRLEYRSVKHCGELRVAVDRENREVDGRSEAEEVCSELAMNTWA